MNKITRRPVQLIRRSNGDLDMIWHGYTVTSERNCLTLDQMYAELERMIEEDETDEN